MKFFKCPKCGWLSRKAYAAVPLKVRISLCDGHWCITDEDFQLPYHTEFETEELSLSGTSCCSCGCSLEMIETERCPHETGADCWDSRYRGMKRRCRLCGEEQQGKIVFNKDI